MGKREERIDEEAAALWRELHDAPPPAGCNGIELIELAMNRCDIAEYHRLHTPSLRDRNLVWPR